MATNVKGEANTSICLDSDDESERQEKKRLKTGPLPEAVKTHFSFLLALCGLLSWKDENDHDDYIELRNDYIQYFPIKQDGKKMPKDVRDKFFGDLRYKVPDLIIANGNTYNTEELNRIITVCDEYKKFSGFIMEDTEEGRSFLKSVTELSNEGKRVLQEQELYYKTHDGKKSEERAFVLLGDDEELPDEIYQEDDESSVEEEDE